MPNPSNGTLHGIPANKGLSNRQKEILGVAIMLGYAAGIALGLVPLGFSTYYALYRDPQQYPLASRSYDVQVADPNDPSQKIHLHLNLFAFTFGAQSNITAFAKLEPTTYNRIYNVAHNYTMAEKHYLWFDGSSCPTIPIANLYAPIPLCKIELDRYPKGNADWNTVYWQGNFSNFKNPLSFSTTGIRYDAEGVYGVILTFFPYVGDDVHVSDPFIRISDAGVT